METNADITQTEKLRTLRQAAEELGVPYFKIQRAARTGLIPTYRLFNSRSYVKISDIEAAMKSGP